MPAVVKNNEGPNENKPAKAESKTVIHQPVVEASSPVLLAL